MDQSAVDAGLLLLRVTLGATIIAHGYNHIYGGGKIEGTAGWFASMGLKPGILHAWLASGTELLGGLLLVLGLANPLAAGAVLGVVVVAWITAHRTNGFFIFKPGQGWEYVMVLALLALGLGLLGPGGWSVDRALGWDTGGWAGGAITAVVGIGGALTLLAVFWRPEKPATA
jgi:putative oxidoreductase